MHLTIGQRRDDQSSRRVAPVGGTPDLSTVGASTVETLQDVDQAYVDPAASVWIDGVLCLDCSISLGGATVDITLDATPASNGVHVIQVHNPEGFSSNELPFCVNTGC